MTTQPDMINSPPHYATEAGIEAIDVIEGYAFGYHLGNAMKYMLRAGRKGPKVEDFRKARWYVLRWVGEVYGGTINPTGGHAPALAMPLSAITHAFGISDQRHVQAIDHLIRVTMGWHIPEDAETDVKACVRCLDALIRDAEASP